MASSNPDSRLVPLVRLQATTFDVSVTRSGPEHFDKGAGQPFHVSVVGKPGKVHRVSLPAPAETRAAVVTGASSGIGEAIAVELARRGHQLVLVARRTDRLQVLAESLSPAAYVLPADLSDRDERAALAGRIAALGLTPDILVNNAGLTRHSPVAKSVPEQQLNVIEVDVAAVVDLCSRFIPG